MMAHSLGIRSDQFQTFPVRIHTNGGRAKTVIPRFSLKKKEKRKGE